MGGGGSSKSVSNTYNTIRVNPVTNINMEEVAAAIRDSSNQQLKIEKAQLALATAGLQLEQQREQEKTTLEFLQDEKTRNQLTLLALIVGGSYIYKHLKKGGK